MKQISVIIVNYNGLLYNQVCIESIRKSTVWQDIQIIVVDNKSSDGSMKLLEEKYKDDEQIILAYLDDNYGFSKANNEGIKIAIEQESYYFLLLNNDTEIEENTIENIINCAQSKGGIIVPKIYYYDDKDVIWYAGGEFSPIINKAIQKGFRQKDVGQYSRCEKSDFANGCCMLLDKDIINAIGFLDERFFLYYEDTEYSFRANKNSINTWFCPEAVVYHKVNGATKGNLNPICAYYIARNWLLCNMTYLKWRKWVFIPYFVLNRFVWASIWILTGKTEFVCYTIQGIRDFLHQRWGKAPTLQ